MSPPEQLIRRLQVRAPAKINPYLAVRGVRDDGYHELTTVFQSVALSDTLVLTLRPGHRQPLAEGVRPLGQSRRRMALALTHDAGPSVPTGSANLVVAAAAALAERLDLDLVILGDSEETVEADLHTTIDLHKRIPVAGGMAGGSVNAAAALVGLNELWTGELSRASLQEIGATLGSDIPFGVIGGSALATGTGTTLAGVLARGTFDWVVCTAAEELSTPEVYAAWDEHCAPGGESEPDAVLSAIASADPEALGAALHNDLQAAAEMLLPRLVGDQKALMDAGALGAIVSGSGPTLLALAADSEEAQRIAGRVAGRFAAVHLTRSPASGPVTTPV
ncbi:4-(cytidine 5'-diphospho)-2-C-methyl-D-erythritol kinase [Euzebya tangerina]|uniref:4-(cytidine 5'-diphospho)-2-C-methyl-D-erythritol kinase n=1 Tax=Euzebya tangerina TaxID=591198 RepID=UPI000E30DFFF|nr:4-(cytidine 5'-diphospho)-2-C-methyl-D-erythritol kinase [Euzebya tangerina]